MKKLLSILVISLLIFGNAYAENENFINKYLSSNELYIKNPKTNFFYGSFKINSDKTKNIKFYYAGRQEIKDGQFYLFYLDNEEPNFLISENTEFFVKEYDQTQSFAPKSVSIKDFNNEKYAPCKLLIEKVNSGELGRKSGKGFYEYNK